MSEQSKQDCGPEPERNGDCPHPETPIEALGNWVWLFVNDATDGTTSAEFNKLMLPSDQILGIEMKFSAGCAVDEPLVLHSLLINGHVQTTSGNKFTYREDDETYYFNATLTDVLDLTDAPDIATVSVNLCRFNANKERDVSGNLSFSVFTA